MVRYQVQIQRYSRAKGKVGVLLDGPIGLSSHKSLKAAGRMLGSIISGKRHGVLNTFVAMGEGYYLYALDTETGLRYARLGCDTGESIP